MKSAIVTAALAFLLVGVFAFLPNQEASADGECFDYAVGLGYLASPTGRGNAGFAFKAGYTNGPDSPPAVNFYYTDLAARLVVKALTIVEYAGYNCSYFGEVCQDRIWSGTAQVWAPNIQTGGTFKGTMPYTMEAIDNGEPGAKRDFVHFVTGNFFTGPYIVVGEVIEGGNIDVPNPSTAPGCQ